MYQPPPSPTRASPTVVLTALPPLPPSPTVLPPRPTRSLTTLRTEVQNLLKDIDRITVKNGMTTSALFLENHLNVGFEFSQYENIDYTKVCEQIGRAHV